MKFSRSMEISLNRGLQLAIDNHHEFFTLDHLLWGTLQSAEMVEMMNSMKINPVALEKTIIAQIKHHTPIVSQEDGRARHPEMTQAVNRVFHDSAKTAQNMEKEEIVWWMVLLNILNQPDVPGVAVLKNAGVDVLKIKEYVSAKQRGQQLPEGAATELGTEGGSALAKFAIDLNARAAANKIDPLIGRSYEITRTAQILSRRRKNNPLLVGEPGVGKTAIAEGLAKMIVDGQAPEALAAKKIWSLNMGVLLAGTKYRGDFEQRIKDVLDEAAKDENIILFIDEIHTLIGAGAIGGGNGMDASNIIKPALASGDLRVIGATTFNEYRAIFEKEKALDRRFQKVDVVEPTPADTVAILKGLKKNLEDHHSIKYTADALQAAVDLSVKYITDRFLPDKAIDLLDEAGAAERLLPPSSRHKFIDKAIIEETVSKVTRIPVAQISSTDKDNLKNLGSDLRANIFGQEEAIEKLTTAVCVSKAGLNDSDKPLGSFLFAGPTGVGKTEVARQLSNSLGIPLVRFDMSEYMEPHSVSRLIGSPPGYVGHEKGGLLTDAVFKTPHCILLLDEIEKAHPDVFNILLQVMDHGSLTDTNGRQVNFRNAFVIMTTNAGAQTMQQNTMGFVKNDRTSEGAKVIANTFAPEFRNRLDAIVSFNALGVDQIAKIVDKNIRLLEAKLVDKNITLDVSDDVRALFAKEGYVPHMGARPMARLIQEKLKKPLSNKILFGDLGEGGIVHVGLDATGELEWGVTPTPQTPQPAKPKTTKRSKETSSVIQDEPVVKKPSRRKKTVPAT